MTMLRCILTSIVFMLMDVVPRSGGWSQDQVSWTPIYVDTANRLDLWTESSTGCECPDGRSNECACCVQPGGCLCSFNLKKCAQCGLEDACQRFCNVSISSRSVAARSGLSWVQIKSPELEGQNSCWWRLHSAPGQRIEVQIHRMVSIGHYNNNTLTCNRGFLQFSDGEMYTPTRQAIQMCAQNGRFSPPIVFFGDQGTATLLVRTESKATRSSLLAYVSFSSADDPIVGFARKGGRLRPHSACDWTYDNCFNTECVITPPGYPGLVPPNRKCKYFLNANITTDKIMIHFTSLNLPPKPLCSTHHVAIWRRNVSNLQNNWGNPWKTLCHESEISLEIDGGAGAIEFRSGATVSPYIYTGFRATVQFIHTGLLVPTTMSPPSLPNSRSDAGRAVNSAPGSRYPGRRPQQQPQSPRRTTPPLIISNNYDEEEEDDDEDYTEPIMGNPRAPYDNNGVHQISCGHIFDGGTTRGTVFRLLIPKDLAPRHKGFSHQDKPSPAGLVKCQLEFRGKPADVVQLAIFNYRLRGSSCSSYMEVYDMAEVVEEVTNQTDHGFRWKLCGPSGSEVKRFTSSHSTMALVTLVALWTQGTVATEYLDGAFRFHDESIEGTVKPMSSCEVVYYGVTSPSTGSVTGPPHSPLLRLSTFPLVCSYSFLPGGNQTVSLTLTRAGNLFTSAAIPGSKVYCRSFCGTSGCQCESKYAALKDIDHLLIVSGTTPISCLCGYFPDALPMTFESHSAITLVYHATQAGSDFSYAASFTFRRKILCANFSIAPPSGSKRWRDALGQGVTSFSQPAREFQQYTYFQCAWVVSIPQRYNLTIDFISEENEKDCNAWNLTLWSGNEQSAKEDYRNVIGSFCPRYGRQEVKVPDDMMEAHIRLVGVSLRPPQFEIRWKYTDVLLPGLNENRSSGGNPILLSKPSDISVFLNAVAIICSCIATFLIAS